MTRDADDPPQDPRRSLRTLLLAIAIGIAAILVFLFTACGVVFAVTGFFGGGADVGIGWIGLACAIVGGAVFALLLRLHGRL